MRTESGLGMLRITRSRLGGAVAAGLAMLASAAASAESVISIRLSAKPSEELVEFVAKYADGYQYPRAQIAELQLSTVSDWASQRCGYVSDKYLAALLRENGVQVPTDVKAMRQMPILNLAIGKSHVAGPECLKFRDRHMQAKLSEANLGNRGIYGLGIHLGVVDEKRPIPWGTDKTQRQFEDALIQLNSNLSRDAAGNVGTLKLGDPIKFPVSSEAQQIRARHLDTEVNTEPQLQFVADGINEELRKQFEPKPGTSPDRLTLFVLNNVRAEVKSLQNDEMVGPATEESCKPSAELYDVFAPYQRATTLIKQRYGKAEFMAVAIADSGLFLSMEEPVKSFLAVDPYFPQQCSGLRDNDGYLCARHGAGIPSSGQFEPTCTQNSWHGTRVSSIALGGIGPDGNVLLPAASNLIRLLHFRIVPRCGESQSLQTTVDTAHLTRAVNWIRQRKSNALEPRSLRVANVSWKVSYSKELVEALDHLSAARVLLVAAAGNDKAELSGKAQQAGPLPAVLGGVMEPTESRLIVGAVDRTGQKRAAFSNHGTQVDIFAPGQCIPGWSRPDENAGQYFLAANSGTSFAAPFVSYAAALLFSISPAINEKIVKRRLLSSADLPEFDESLGQKPSGAGKIQLPQYERLLKVLNVERAVTLHLAHVMVDGQWQPPGVPELISGPKNICKSTYTESIKDAATLRMEGIAAFYRVGNDVFVSEKNLNSNKAAWACPLNENVRLQITPEGGGAPMSWPIKQVDRFVNAWPDLTPYH